MARAEKELPALPKELHYIPGHTPRAVTLDDFDVGKQIGAGRYGSVFVARDKRTNGIVALKRLKTALIVEDRMEHQVKRELEIMQKLQHPNILRLLTYFVDKEHINLVVEYALNGDLWNKLLKAGSFPLQTTARLVSQLAVAIDYAHKHNVIHRDIKPENLLLDADNNLKLADFGWSVMDPRPRQTVCGTPDYIPPEMAGNRTYDCKVDNWCIGVFCYECLYGKPPFEAQDDNVRTRRILSQDYTFPEEPRLPEEAYDLIRNLLRVDPNKRMTLDQVLSHPFITKYYKARAACP